MEAEVEAESEASSDVDVSVRVQTSSKALAHGQGGSALLVRWEPSAALETAETVCRCVLGVIGVVLIMAGHVSRVLAETCSVAGRTAVMLARGEGDDNG